MDGVVKTGGGLFLLICLALLASTAYYELTQHLGDVRPGSTETRFEIWQRLENNLRARQRKGDDGRDYYAASCMLSTVRTEGSNRLGEANPHFKLAACVNGVCDYAIIGVAYDEPAVVTSRAGVPLAVFKKEVHRDLCITVPVDDVLAVLDGRLPVP